MKVLLKALAVLVVGVNAAKPTAKPTSPASPTNPPTSATLGKPCTAKIAGPADNPKIMSDSCGAGESCTIEYDDDGNLVAGVCELAKCSGMADPDVLDYNPENEASVRVTICHRTCSATNPWVRITIDDDAWEDLGNDCQAGGHKREHNVTIDCKTKIQRKADAEGISFAAARTAIWGANDADYLIKWHGTREAVRINNEWTSVSVNNAGKATFSAEEKDYWGYWERACPYVRHGMCCGTEELGACCGDNPFPKATIKLTKYSCTAATTCSATTVTSASCKDDLLSGTTNDAAKYCYKIENTGSMNLCAIDMTDPAWASGKATLPGCLAVGEVKYTEYSTGTKFPNAGIIVDETATVYGTPASSDGKILDGAIPVKASDPSRLQGDAVASPPTASPAPAVKISKTSVSGSASGSSCTPGSEMVSGTAGDAVHYCYEVTNTGNTYLKNVKVSDQCNLPMSGNCGLLAPGGSCRVSYNLSLPAGGQTCPGVVVGTPSDSSGTELGLTDVTHSDPSGLQEATDRSVPTASPAPKINIEKTSVSGSATGSSCNPGSEMVAGMVGKEVHYCYEVTNTGNTYLNNVKVSDQCNGPMSGSCGLLPPGGSCRVAYNLSIPAGGENCPGLVVGTPSDSSGSALGLTDVTDSDPSGLQEASENRECTVETMTEPMPGGRMKITETETCVTCNCI